MGDQSIDVQLKKAFQELQLKMVDTRQKIIQSDRLSELHRVEKTKATITKNELLSLPNTTVTYQSLGRMFVCRSLNDTVAYQDSVIASCDEKIAGLQKQKEYLEKNLRDSEANLREMVQARQANR